MSVYLADNNCMFTLLKSSLSRADATSTSVSYTSVPTETASGPEQAWVIMTQMKWTVMRCREQIQPLRIHLDFLQDGESVRESVCVCERERERGKMFETWSIDKTIEIKISLSAPFHSGAFWKVLRLLVYWQQSNKKWTRVVQGQWKPVG